VTFHRNPLLSARFDDTNLVSAASLTPARGLAMKIDLGILANKHLLLPGYFGANTEQKVTNLVAGMVAGADWIDDLALLRRVRARSV